MTYIPNSIEARDVVSLVHMQTNLRKYEGIGPLVITHSEGCRVYDDSGREYLESVAGMWCASVGHPLVGDMQGTGLIVGMELMHNGQKRRARRWGTH